MALKHFLAHPMTTVEQDVEKRTAREEHAQEKRPKADPTPETVFSSQECKHDSRFTRKHVISKMSVVLQ
ncbi:MAG: hypothetical protein ACXWJZ_02780 [Burkholderiaceae bacterium]